MTYAGKCDIKKSVADNSIKRRFISAIRQIIP